MLDAELGELGAAALDAGFVVVVGDEGEPDEEAVCHAFVGEEMAQVAVNNGLLAAGVVVEDFRVGVLDVDNPLVNVWDEAVDVMAPDMEAGLDVEFPKAVLHLCKLFDEEAANTWFAAPESHATACGEEIKVVYRQFLKQNAGADDARDAVGIQALAVDAVFAVQRASVKGHQGGDALAIDSQTVPPDANDGCFLHEVIGGSCPRWWWGW